MKNTLTRVTPAGIRGRITGTGGGQAGWMPHGEYVADRRDGCRLGQAQRASQGRASRTADSNITACTNAWGRLPRN